MSRSKTDQRGPRGYTAAPHHSELKWATTMRERRARRRAKAVLQRVEQPEPTRHRHQVRWDRW